MGETGVPRKGRASSESRRTGRQKSPRPGIDAAASLHAQTRGPRSDKAPPQRPEPVAPASATIDATDRAILRVLMMDGRASHRDIAEQVDASLATVNRRIRQMEDEGTIQGYTVRIDPEAVGWNLTAIIGLRIEKGHLRTVQEDMAEDLRIFGVYDITGEWDGIVLARLRDRADLDDLTKTTLSHEHVTRTNTMVVLKTVLEDPRVPVL